MSKVLSPSKCFKDMKTDTNLSLAVKCNVKQLRSWFVRWHKWQRRIIVCRIIDNCSNTHLMILATSLEPIIHLDFTSSLHPLMAALHHEGSEIFKIQRVVRHTDIDHSALPYAMNMVGLIIPKEVQPLFLPSLPLTHLKHKPTPSSSKHNSSLTLPPIDRKFNSVPNIPLVVRTRRCTHEYRPGHHKAFTNGQDRQQHHKHSVESFKSQLTLISKWMTESNGQEIVYILLELVKSCDKELIGYLVQCVYHKLQTEYGLDNFSDDVLLKVFSHLDALSLCNCVLVSHRWYNIITSRPSLWRDLCTDLGRREGVGDVVGAIEGVHNINTTHSQLLSVVIDWKQAYHDLTKLMSKIKKLIIKKTLVPSELQKQKKESERLRKLTSAQLRSSMTIREMIDIVCCTTGGMSINTCCSTHQAAPESATAQHRKQKKENLSEQSESMKEPANNEEDEWINSFKSTRKESVIHLLDVAIDSRPNIPSLPNPEGIECLILAGYLSHQDRPRAGRIEPLPSLERLADLSTCVLCLQCDERKIVGGCADRLIRIYDIRSGRLVSVLSGHKGSVQCLQFDDNKIVSGSWDTTCIVWNVVHLKALKTLTGHVDCVSCLQFNETTLVTGCCDQTLKVWEVSSWLCLRTICPAHTGPITCLSFNGLTIISGSEDKSVKLWNIGTGECESILKHSNTITSLELSKLLLTTATSDGVIYLWNISTSSLLMEWKMESSKSVTIVDIAVDKGKIYAAGSNGVIYEQDIATGACVRMIQGHSKSLTAIWVGNSKIVSTAEDQTLCVWQPDKFIFQSGEIENFYSYVPIKIITL